MNLETGIVLLRANYSGPEAKQILERSLSIVDRAIKEKKYASKRAEFWFPGNRASTWRTHVFARAFLGLGMDLEALRNAAGDFEAFCAKMGRPEWSQFGPENYHEAVRLALITRDIPYARKLMTSKRNFGSALQQHRLWTKLLTTLDDANSPLNDSKLLDRMDSLFDRMRHPHKPAIAALEMAIIRYQYFESGGAIDLTKAIDLLGA